MFFFGGLKYCRIFAPVINIKTYNKMKNLTNKFTNILPFVIAGGFISLIIYNVLTNGIANI